jgi:L-arabinokinase
MTSLVYYVSGHGFGHAVRSAEIIRALGRRRPGLHVHLRTTAPAWLFPAVESFQSGDLDAGVVQPDALHIDRAATLARAAQLARESETLVAVETDFLRRVGAGLVVGDVPPLAFLAARAAGLPGVAVANFSWDWIYRPYVRARPEYAWLLEWLRRAYGCADLLLRLPFHGDLSAFRAIEDVPLVNRPPSAARAALRGRLDLRPAELAVLLSFGGFGLTGLDVGQLAVFRRYTFIATEKEVSPGSALPANLRLVPAYQHNYTDLLAACDAVVSKPGFGIVASCLAERVPLLYTDRGDFPEYAVLVEAIHRYGRGRHIPQSDLLAGNLGPHLDELFGTPASWPPLRTDGAEVVAARLLEIGRW